MKRIKWIALLLVFAVLFTGCSGMSFRELMDEVGAQIVTPFSDMQYTRPDISKMETALDDCCNMAKDSADKDALMEKVWAFYNLYNTFYTQYNLASIYYFRDMTDSKWEEEYSFCLQNSGSAEAMLEEMFYALAACPLKDALEDDEAFGEGFFDAYMGEALWDETFLDLMDKEAALEEEYYELCAQAQAADYYSDEYFTQYGAKMGDVFVELVALRQDIAEYAGYEDYPSFAYDFYHYRDYTPQQAESYLQEICTELVPLYRQVESQGVGIPEYIPREADILAYVENCSKAMGGTVSKAFQVMKEKGLYDIAYSDKKYDGSFEVYLTDYYAPYVLVNPSGSVHDKLTFTHEFGHFCNDYASYGSAAGVDVAEVFSQGLEYLSLSYGEPAGYMAELKMVDGLRIYVEQAAYALFEHQVYDLEGAELTAENVYALYDEIGSTFGFDTWGWDSRDFVMIGHFYTDPMYIISYVVSNDAALQLYQMEQEETGTGLALYEKELTTEQTYFLKFLTEAGLESPFVSGRIKEVRKTFEQVLA